MLNRILPVDGSGIPVDRDGRVQRHGQQLHRQRRPGGNIWFYSPNGIIVGPTAVFNVGSLILTTNDIAFVPIRRAPSSARSTGPAAWSQFTGPAGSTGFVEVQPGAQINATGANAYVALVAPRVVQGGIVQADGQIAYLAAEQVDMTINGGLFDFALTVGTDRRQRHRPHRHDHRPGLDQRGRRAAHLDGRAAQERRADDAAVGLDRLHPGGQRRQRGQLGRARGGLRQRRADRRSGQPRSAASRSATPTFRNALTAYASDAIGVAPGRAAPPPSRPTPTLYGLNAVGVTAESGEQVTAAATCSQRRRARGRRRG